MRWTKTTLVALSFFAFANAACNAAEPEDAGLSAAQSSVRDARDSVQGRDKMKESRPAQLKCADGKTDCRPDTERADQQRSR